MPTSSVTVKIERRTYPRGINNTETEAYQAYAMDLLTGAWIDEAPIRDRYDEAADDASVLREKHGATRMGRPRQHTPGSRRRVTLELPADLLSRIEDSGHTTLTDYITAAIAERLARE